MPESFSISTSDADPRGNVTLVLYVDDTLSMGRRAERLWAATGLDLERIAAATTFAGRAGHMVDIPAPQGSDFSRIVLLGRGAGDDDFTAWSHRGGSLVGKLKSIAAGRAAVVVDDPGATRAQIAALAAGARLRAYRFDKHFGNRARDDHALSLTLHVEARLETDSSWIDAMAVAEGTLLARDLTNEPANHLGPDDVASVANGLSEIGLSVDVLLPEDMQRLGMGALLGVGQGASRPPRLVVLQWSGGAKSDAPVALVGKGIVFDSGGLSIKGATNMDAMKGDMGGAAAVLGTMQSLALRKAPVNAVGLLALAENMPDGNAFRPGDVLTAMSGTTIEIINTDAEGRLVLADALWYAQERFKPRVMIDVATLTGAVRVALGHDYAGLFANRDDLAQQLMAAGRATGENLWHLPMGSGYEKRIESRFADIKNQGGREGGASIAAQFLAHFVNDVPWAHIDIAGTAFGTPATETNASWATGFGVASLDRFIRDNYEG